MVIVQQLFVCGQCCYRRRRHAAKSNNLSAESADVSNNAHRQHAESTAAGSSSLSFTPVLGTENKADARPKAQVKPMVKPDVKPKPRQAADNIYENYVLPQQSSAPGPTSTAPASSQPNSKGPAQGGKRGSQPQKAARPQLGAERASMGGKEPLTDDEELDALWSEEPVYSNDPSYVNIQPNYIRLDMLQKTIVDSLQEGKVAVEFGLMVGLKDYPMTNGQRTENRYKNRFSSIVPYDKNRVVLEQVDGDDSSDYVNASFIKGYKSEKAYIASQGPRVNTQDDFWRMVWQEGVTDIVMLTNLTEGNKPKCHEYWPAKGASVNTGRMEVTGLEEEEKAHFVVRTFSVGRPQSKEKRRVRQYHYLKWMDHEVPSTTPLIDFWHYVRARAPRTSAAPPLLVHCSAGVGRTGTFIALDILMDQAQQEEEISIHKTVDDLREDRCHMVQNKSQYEFLHEAVLEAHMSGDSRLETSALDGTFPMAIRHDQPHQRIDAEFERLCKMRTCLTHPSHTVASLEENIQKNRNTDALPDDKHLVYITEHMKGRNQYINAVYLPTYLSARGSIVTQLPLADTLVDLWRLVSSWDVSTIVCLGDMQAGKDMCSYWPTTNGKPVKAGAYTISLMLMKALGNNLASYTVDMKKGDKSRQIHVLHYDAWKGDVADNISDLIRLLDILNTSHKDAPTNPVIVQCIDGVSKSGVLCALWDVISRMTYDSDLDVYLAVRHVHTVRPEAITSVVQYRFIYEVVQQYKSAHSVYANM